MTERKHTRGASDGVVKLDVTCGSLRTEIARHAQQ